MCHVFHDNRSRNSKTVPASDIGRYQAMSFEAGEENEGEYVSSTEAYSNQIL